MVLIISLSSEPLDMAGIQETVRSDRVGEIVVFTGEARNQSVKRGSAVLHFDADIEIAEAKMRRIAEEEALRFGANVAICHRIGEVFFGDVAVMCVAACRTRTAAFECCQRLVERVRLEVPIWMREYDIEELELEAV